MQRILLRTHHACAHSVCRFCYIVEEALRRAALRCGIGLPDHVGGGPNQEGFISGDRTMVIEHSCSQGDKGLRSSDPSKHLELEVDGVLHLVPCDVSLLRLERFFLRILKNTTTKNEGPPAFSGTA